MNIPGTILQQLQHLGYVPMFVTKYHYNQEVYLDNLFYVFGYHKSPYLTVIDRRHLIALETGSWGQEMGWLTPMEIVQLDSQSSEGRFYLTEAGKERFGIKD